MIKRDKSIDIVKGFGIALMVIGHSGCPKWMSDFIYSFHMPLFFICSGYFYKPIKEVKDLFSFAKKKFVGLYFPYVKLSVLFLLLHNIFYKLNIYSNEYGYLGSTSSLYNFKNIVFRLFEIFFSMEAHEGLLGGFWFIRVLLFSAIGFSVLDYLLHKWKRSILKDMIIFLFLLLMSAFSWYTSMHFWVFDDLFRIFYGCLFFYLGYLYRSYGLVERLNSLWINVGCLLLVVCCSIYIPTGMSLSSSKLIISYLASASAGSLLVFNLSRNVVKYRFSSWLTYIGRNTMIILALHFLSFKIISLIKIYIYGLPIKMLSCFPVIEEYNQYFWIAYVLVGVGIPLLIDSFYNKIRMIINKV